MAKVTPRPLGISHKDERPDFGCDKISCFVDCVSSSEIARIIMKIGLWENRTVGPCLKALCKNLLGETAEIQDSFFVCSLFNDIVSN
jgi:hypothetical protein